MRYFYRKPDFYMSMYGVVYECEHIAYNRCTLYLIKERGLGVIQQRYDANGKITWWGEIDPWLTDELYLNPNFLGFFNETAAEERDGLYPTVTVRRIMWALKMKPLPREPWETAFDRNYI